MRKLQPYCLLILLSVLRRGSQGVSRSSAMPRPHAPPTGAANNIRGPGLHIGDGVNWPRFKRQQISGGDGFATWATARDLYLPFGPLWDFFEDAAGFNPYASRTNLTSWLPSLWCPAIPPAYWTQL